MVPSRSSARALGGAALSATLALMVMVAVAIAVLFIVTGVFAGWLLWILAGWFFFGRRRRALGIRGARLRVSVPRVPWLACEPCVSLLVLADTRRAGA